MRWMGWTAAAAIALGGGGCFPTDPGCEFEEACAEGEVRQCINFCARVATAEQADEGDVLCALNPCDEVARITSRVRKGDLCDSNFIDARNDPREVFEGCLPCELGTVCAPPGEDGERRCIRLCEEDGGRVPELCACTAQRCEDRGDTFDPETGERQGRFFCSECTLNRHRFCESTDECCDRLATCVAYTGARNTDNIHCCRDQGVECDPSEAKQCCGDAVCDPNTFTCAACTRLGQSVRNSPCCPGLEAVTMFEGRAPVCQPCGFFDDKFLCSRQSLVIRGGQSPESVPIPNTGLSYREVVGHVGGDLDVTRDDVRQVEWNLTDDHRAFFFDRRLSNGVSTNDRYFSLPFNDVVGVSNVRPIADPEPWRSVRVYDAGECSLFLDWEQLSGIIGTEVAKALLTTDLLEDIPADLKTLEFVEIIPTLRTTPLYPGVFPLGPEDADDSIEIRLRLRISPLLFDCGIATITIRTGIRSEPAIEDSSPQDAEFARVGCVLGDEVLDPDYICMLPIQEDGDWSVQRQIIPRLDFDQDEAEDPRDPQLPLIAGSALSSLQACLPGRDRRRVGDDYLMDFTERRIEAGRATFEAPFCQPDDVDCAGICAGLGSQCGSNTYFRLTGILGVAPPGGASCTAGQCCLSAFVCDGACRDLETDTTHCGGCGFACGAGDVCAARNCCAPEQACDGQCRDLDSDPAHCGGCGIACVAGDECDGGSCCVAGATCDGACRDLQTDVNHCGACDRRCTGALPICIAGECA